MQSETVANARWPFEVRVGKVYTRAVFNCFEETMKLATAYHIIEDPNGGRDSWLVQHTNNLEKLVWGQHLFRVIVDKENQLFKCECKVLEHTSMV